MGIRPWGRLGSVLAMLLCGHAAVAQVASPQPASPPDRSEASEEAPEPAPAPLAPSEPRSLPTSPAPAQSAASPITAGPTAGSAAAGPATGEIALFALEDKVEQLVFSSAKVEQTVREAPSIGSTVGREQLQLFGWTSINEVLTRQPGFAQSQDYEKRTVTARGFYEGWNNNHILLLFDGLPYNESFYGMAFTMETTPLFLLKSMEVLRGPGSALYGSNAINGVISLNSLSASDLPAPAIGLVRIGTQNTQTYDVVTGKEFRNFAFLVAYNHHTTDGFSYLDPDGSARRDSTGALQQFPTKDARNSHFGFIKLEGKRALEGLSLQTHILYSGNQTGHGWLWYASDDDSESIHEERELVSLRYAPRSWRTQFSPEFVVRYQHRSIDYHTKLYPNNTVIPSASGSTTYADGLVENIQTSFHDVFLRAQLGWRPRPGMSLIGGVEDTVFMYRGDALHQSNVDLNLGGSGQPFSPAGLRDLGPYLEWLGSNPVNNTGIYLQYLSGRILRDFMSVTAGLRLDLQTFQYSDLTQQDRPTVHGTNYAVSPRLAVLLFPHRSLTIKLLGNRAFRAPALAELFAANTYLLGSNPKALQPEIISTGELGLDTTIVPYLNLRANGFYQYLENAIGYAPSTNTLLNLYTRGVIGIEVEALARASVGRVGEFQGFANYSYAHTVQETVPSDSGLTSHPGRLTWAPGQLFNLAIGYTGHGFAVSTQLHYQGSVERRDSDRVNPTNLPLRPDSVPSWVTVDARVSFSPTAWLQLGVQANNLLNQQGYLIKPGDFPFDYRIDGARVLGTVQVQAGPF